MALSPGESLGPYEIVGQIGAGGMGEVYRARDARLGREVAVKVSAEHFSERFEREARLIASLNHQNICSVFDVGPNFLVMELVEGQTLAERIAEGPIPADEALRLAAQIAQALESAHESGIVHRDLKPGNIKIRPDGTVKVLDFGLAKMGTAVTSSGIDSPTISIAATQAGMILGTAAYMSPEQARGKPVDKRADIWAFGAVLYEMLTGRQLFEGEDLSEILATVITREPDLEGVPPNIRRVLRRCLEKDPKKRLRDISGVALLLEQEPAASPAGTPPRWSWVWPAAALLATFAAVALGVGWYRAQPAEAVLEPLVRLNVDLGPDVSFASSALTGSNIAISPDGGRLAFISQSRLFTLRLDQAAATELAGTEGAYHTFFSPDGRWIAFFAGGKLKKVSVDGGPALVLADSVGRGGSWGEDGTIVVTNSTGPLFRIPEAGGAPSPLTELGPNETTHRWPQVVPGTRAVVYTANRETTGFSAASIKIHSLIDGRDRVLHEGGTYGRIVQTRRGHAYLTYVSGDTLFAAPFDMDRLEPTGSPVPVLEKVEASQAGAVELTMSAGGTLVHRGQTGAGLLVLQWMDAAGGLQPLLAKPGAYARPSLSPLGGDRVAMEVNGPSGTDVWIYEPRRDNMSRVTFGGGTNASPIWTPDGRYIIYQDSGGMSSVRSDGGAQQPLLRSPRLQFPWSISSDSKRLAYLEAARTGYDLWTVPIEVEATSVRAGKPEPFLTTDADERSPSLSPDGRWMAYSSNESGTFEVYVRAFPDSGAKWQVSSGGGSYPLWSRSGRELFFESPEARVMTAAYTVSDGSFVSDKPRLWSPTPLVNLVNSIKNYDLAPDGRRIVALIPAASAKDAGVQRHVTFLFNFFDELERRIPPSR